MWLMIKLAYSSKKGLIMNVKMVDAHQTYTKMEMKSIVLKSRRTAKEFFECLGWQASQISTSLAFDRLLL